MKKFIQFAVFLVLFIGVSILVINTISGDIKEAEKPTAAVPVVADQVPAQPKPNDDPLAAIKPLSNDDFTRFYEINKFYEEMHGMANTLIIAKDGLYRGWREVNELNLKIARKKAELYPIEDKEKMLEIISRWEKNDFSHAVEDHNYFWKKYEGELGEAVKLRPEIQKIVDEQRKKASK